MHFPETFRVKVTSEGKVRVSFKVTDTIVFIKECSISEFEQVIAEYRAQAKSYVKERETLNI